MLRKSDRLRSKEKGGTTKKLNLKGKTNARNARLERAIGKGAGRETKKKEKRKRGTRILRLSGGKKEWPLQGEAELCSVQINATGRQKRFSPTQKRNNAASDAQGPGRKPKLDALGGRRKD